MLHVYNIMTQTHMHTHFGLGYRLERVMVKFYNDVNNLNKVSSKVKQTSFNADMQYRRNKNKGWH